MHPVFFGTKRRIFAPQFNSGSCRQNLQGLGKIQPLNFHHEFENIASFATAAKTMPKLAGGRYKKRRRFFRMKRTIGLKVYPGFLQTDIGLNEIHYIQAEKTP